MAMATGNPDSTDTDGPPCRFPRDDAADLPPHVLFAFGPDGWLGWPLNDVDEIPAMPPTLNCPSDLETAEHNLQSGRKPRDRNSPAILIGQVTADLPDPSRHAFRQADRLICPCCRAGG
jgi:hypothetical protein